MSEPLTLAAVIDGMRDLHANFPARMTDDQLKRRAATGFEALSGVSEQAFRSAVRRAIRESEFFPKPAKLLEFAHAFARAEAMQLRGPVKEGSCPLCLAPYEQTRRYRPAIVPNDFRCWLVSADGKWLLLEAFDRDMCRCAAKPVFVPYPDVSPAAMPLSAVKIKYPLRRTSIGVVVAA